jgi:hypothetical protein
MNATNQTASFQPSDAQPSNLLARYLQAIAEHLPASTREDVLAELRANLQAQLDDRAEELNRPLTDADIAPILQQHGRPFLVAARYLPQQYLIGPALFPYYLMILRKVTPFALLACFLAQSSDLLYAHTLPDVLRTLGLSFAQLFPNLLLILFWITLSFVIAEYAYNKNNAKLSIPTWNPAKLPRLRSRLQGKSRATRIADLIFHACFLLYILAIPTHLYLFLGPCEILLHQLYAQFAPIWHTFYIAFIIVLVFQLSSKLLALNPAFDPWRIPFDLLTKLASLGCTAILLTTHTYLLATNPAAPQAMLQVANYWLGMSIRIVFIFSLAALLIEAWKHYAPTFRTKTLAF